MKSQSAAMSTEMRYPWVEGFDTVFDAMFFDTLKTGVERQIRLSELGVLSHAPDYGNTVPVEAIRCIKREQGYTGLNDPIKFALGARAAYQILKTEAQNV